MKRVTMFALIIATLLVVAWPRAQAKETVHFPGIPGDSPLGVACFCPSWPIYGCGCAITVIGP